MFILKPRGCSGVWVGSWKKGVKSYSIHRIWHENRKEGFAINQDRTCCRWAGLEGEIKNQVSDMFSLRNLSGIEVETLSSSWMDKSRVQGEGDKWSLKPATRGNSDKWAKKPKDRILEALSLRTCGNKEQLAKKTEKEWPLRTKTRRAEYSGSEGRSQDEGSDRLGQMWLTGQKQARRTAYSVFSNWPQRGQWGLSAAATWPAAWAKESVKFLAK